MKTAPQIQADLTAEPSQERRKEIIESAPEAMRARLISHSRTVQMLKRRKK